MIPQMMRLAIAGSVMFLFSVAAKGESELNLDRTVLEGMRTLEAKPCNTWQRNTTGCTETVEGLPDDVPRSGTVITVDTARNRAYLFRDGALVAKGSVATGMDRTMKRGSREWLFRTPRGRLRVLRKVVDPVWTKPDWAFVEEGKPIPRPDSPKRLMRGKMGKYALDLGDGILIHGTDDPGSIGKKATHGCVRMPDKFMRRVYREADVGTEVWIY